MVVLLFSLTINSIIWYLVAYILEYKGSTEWVEPKILEIKKVLDQMSVPNLNENCDTCSYVESVQTYNT